MNRQGQGIQEIFQRQTHGGVGQDKKPPGRFTARRGEPATADNPAVGSKGGQASVIPVAVDRPTHHGSETRRTEQVSGRVLPFLKTAITPSGKTKRGKDGITGSCDGG